MSTIIICYTIPHSFIQLILPEYGIHVLITVLLLVCGYWFTFIFNIPLLAYHIWRFVDQYTHTRHIHTCTHVPAYSTRLVGVLYTIKSDC